MAQYLLSAGLVLSKQGLWLGKGRWQEIRNSGFCSAMDESICDSGCRMVTRGCSYHSPIFSLIIMSLGAEDQELGQSISLLSCFLLAGGVV
jgi:hypothetical protein